MRVSATQKQRLRALADRHLITVAALLRGAVNEIALDSDDPQPFRTLGCGRRK